MRAKAVFLGILAFSRLLRSINNLAEVDRSRKSQIKRRKLGKRCYLLAETAPFSAVEICEPFRFTFQTRRKILRAFGSSRGLRTARRSKPSEVLVSLRFAKKPILVRRGDELRIVKHADQGKYRSLPGARWEKRKAVVHFCAGKFFTVDADGKCRACRVGGTCRPINVEVLDITHSPMPRVPMIKRVRPDAPTYRAELKDFIAQLPPDLRRELTEFMKQNTLSPEELRKLDEIVRRPWRMFEKRAEWINADGKKIPLTWTTSWQATGEDREEPARTADDLRQLLASAKQRNP